MEPNGQNQHFAELRQKLCSSIHYVVHQRGLRSLNSKLEGFVTKKMKKAVAKLMSDRLYSDGDFGQTCRDNFKPQWCTVMCTFVSLYTANYPSLFVILMSPNRDVYNDTPVIWDFD